ncbi:CidA/LrgA family protein [Halomonas sp. WWR20]
MPLLRGFLWLIAFQLLGETLVWLFVLPVSASVVGLLLLTAWLMWRGRVSDDLTAASQPLITFLTMLIMPGVVGVFFMGDLLRAEWLPISGALIGGTLLSVITTLLLLKTFTGESRD